MELKVRLYLEDENAGKFMGEGPFVLLSKTKELGSLNKAAKELGISYTKSYNLIKKTEKVLGKELLNRKKGGAERSGATLSDFGERFLSLYDEFQKESKTLIKDVYDKFEIKLIDLKKGEIS